MAAVKLLDFSDIYTAVMEELKIPVSDLVTLARVKRNINMTYVNMVAPHRSWPWKIKRTDIIHPKYHAVGTSDTASVTEDSTIVTLSSAPSAALGSFLNYFFAVDSTVYTVSAHTAGSASVTLSVAFQESTNATAGFKIWTDKLTLPTDAQQVTRMSHERKSRVVIPKGHLRFDEIAQNLRIREDFIKYYSEDDFVDPSAGTGETESDRQKQVRIYPAVYDKDQVIHVEFAQEVTELDSDGDEPIMPIEDRIVLYYGGLMLSWSRDRNPEMAVFNKQLFDEKLRKMAAKLSKERPRIEIDDQYLQSKRSNSSSWRY